MDFKDSGYLVLLWAQSIRSKLDMAEYKVVMDVSGVCNARKNIDMR